MFTQTHLHQRKSKVEEEEEATSVTTRIPSLSLFPMGSWRLFGAVRSLLYSYKCVSHIQTHYTYFLGFKRPVWVIHLHIIHVWKRLTLMGIRCIYEKRERERERGNRMNYYTSIELSWRDGINASARGLQVVRLDAWSDTSCDFSKALFLLSMRIIILKIFVRLRYRYRKSLTFVKGNFDSSYFWYRQIH